MSIEDGEHDPPSLRTTAHTQNQRQRGVREKRTRLLPADGKYREGRVHEELRSVYRPQDRVPGKPDVALNYCHAYTCSRVRLA